MEKLNEGAVVAEPGSSSRKKTGSWRTFRPVVTDKCVACGICVLHCPEPCIELKPSKDSKASSGKIAVIDYDYCKGCLICMNVCPHDAIRKEMER